MAAAGDKSLSLLVDGLMHDSADHKRCRDANLSPEARAVHKCFSVFHQALLYDWIIDLHAKCHSIT